MGNLLMAGQFDRPAQSPLGVQERVPYPGEVDFFKSSGIPGYAADDDQIVMNPFNRSPVASRDAVRMNEAARVRIRQTGAPTFDLTPDQTNYLNSIPYYSTASDQDRKSTMAGRLISGDPSAGQGTPDQQNYVNNLMKMFGR